MWLDGLVDLIVVIISARRFFGCRSEGFELWGAGLGGGNC